MPVLRWRPRLPPACQLTEGSPPQPALVGALLINTKEGYGPDPMPPKTLSVEDVCRIHDALCEDFAAADDPIFPAGVKSMPLLESAVHRQHAGFGPFRKYTSLEANAATLTFGLCNDHPFHNGNKRTALVSMLAHLDANKRTLQDTRQEDLFEMILALANNQMTVFVGRRSRRSMPHLGTRHSADAEVEGLAAWLAPRLQTIKRGERQVTYRELRGILRRFNLELQNPHANMIDVCRVVERRKFLSRDTVIEYKRIGTIGYHSEGQPVALKVVKDVRRIAGLREEDGCDSEAFYAGGAVFDVFINQYRTILRRLSKR
jgi:death-on-curing family protein